MRVDRRARAAFIAGCITLAAGGIGFRVAVAELQVYLRKESVPLREPLDTIPATLGRWKQVGKDAVFSDALVEELGTRNYLDRYYAVDGDPDKGVLEVHAAYYTGMIDTVPHIPERCWNANGMSMIGQPAVRPLAVDDAGWNTADGPQQPGTGARYPFTEVRDTVTRRSTRVNLPLGKLEMTVSTFQDPRSPRDTSVGGYLFIANGASTPSALAVRNLSFKLTDRYAYYCKIQFSVRLPGEPDKVLPQFDRMTADIMKSLLPQVMRCLPDWPAIERGESTPAGTT
jgi:hypothetical protein